MTLQNKPLNKINTNTFFLKLTKFMIKYIEKKFKEVFNMYLVIVSFRYGEQTEPFIHSNLEDAYNEVRFQLKDKTSDSSEDYALIYEIIPGKREPKFICNDDAILNISDDVTLDGLQKKLEEYLDMPVFQDM